jgi:hypothetical protein
VESLGLPARLEGRWALAVPVLAPGRDYVCKRDVCEPAADVRPRIAPRSIADAVRRFLSPGFRRDLPVLSAREGARMLAE